MPPERLAALESALIRCNHALMIPGFGFNHDGTIPDLFRFMSTFDSVPPFPPGVGIPLGSEGTAIKRKLEDFMLAFDGDLAVLTGPRYFVRRLTTRFR